MKILLLLLGVVFSGGGAFMSLGAFVDMMAKAPESPLAVNVVILILLGLFPLFSGIYFCYKALKTDNSNNKDSDNKQTTEEQNAT